MRTDNLTYDECVLRLEHSFIRISHGYWRNKVDFQHPGIKDMLLKTIQDVPVVRKRYIQNASPFGLSSIIAGFSTQNNATGNLHNLIIENDEENALLMCRINDVIFDSISYDLFNEIMSSVRILLPKDAIILDKRDNFDVKAFALSKAGQILKSVLQSLAKIEFYNSKKFYSLNQWNEILCVFYELSQSHC